jgi:carbon monoxide dehydrogenase subunit G
MAPCIPGCEAIEVIDDSRYKAAVKVKLGPVAATFRLEVEVTAMTPPDEVFSKTRGEEGSRASQLTAESWLGLQSLGPAETRVSYASEVSVVGRLGRYGLGMMQKKAEALGRDFAAAFAERLTAPVVAE